MTRGVSEKLENYYNVNYPDLNPLFTFAVPGYNVRNSEMYAVLGSSQLQRLDNNISARYFNFDLWLSLLNQEKYFINRPPPNVAPSITKDWIICNEH